MTTKEEVPSAQQFGTPFPDAPTQRNRLIACVVAAAVFILFHYILPTPEGLPHEALSAAGILLCCIVLWVSEAVPFTISVLLIYFLLPFTGVLPFKAIADPALSYTGAPLPSVFLASDIQVPIFCLFIFTVSGAVMATPIPYRAARAALNFAGSNKTKLMVSMSLVCAIMSMFIADLAAAVIFCGIGLSIVEANGGKKKESELGKAMTICCGVAAAIGGAGTPMGNGINVLSMSLVEQFMGVTVTFGQWCVTMIPIVLVASFLNGLYCAKAFKCEDIKPEAMSVVSERLSQYGKLTFREKKLIVWFVIVFGTSLASTWIPSITSMLVAFFGGVLAYVPGISLLTKEDFDKIASWDTVMMLIGIQCLVTGLVGTGIAKWVVGIVFVGAENWPFLLLVFACCVVTMILHILIPVGPATASIALPFMFAIAASVPALNGTLIAGIGGTMAAVTSILPIDAIMLVAYKFGWISMSDWLKKGWPPTVMLCIICTIMLPILTGFFAQGCNVGS